MGSEQHLHDCVLGSDLKKNRIIRVQRENGWTDDRNRSVCLSVGLGQIATWTWIKRS